MAPWDNLNYRHSISTVTSENSLRDWCSENRRSFMNKKRVDLGKHKIKIQPTLLLRVSGHFVKPTKSMSISIGEFSTSVRPYFRQLTRSQSFSKLLKYRYSYTDHSILTRLTVFFDTIASYLTTITKRPKRTSFHHS